MRGRSILAAIVVATPGTAVIGSAGAGTPGGAAAARVDLSTRSAVERFLAAKGIDASNVVIQRGVKNYAGPNCPGRGWRCTTATRVVQVAAENGGQNKFECSPSTPADELPDEDFPPEGFPDEETEEPDVCVIVQANVDDDNVARCVERSDEPVAVQRCFIAQLNVNGDNRAVVDQVAHSNEGDDQAADQDATVFQRNANGDNLLHSRQQAHLSAEKNGGVVEQMQSADLDLDVTQQSLTGRQRAHGEQHVNLDEKATGAVLGGTQSQVSDLRGSVHQNSVDVSHAAVHQRENLEQIVPEHAVVAQTQFGPLDCCTDQLGNDGNRFQIIQHSSLKASEETAFQTTALFAHCLTSGLCTANQHARTNTDSEQNRCSGLACFIAIVCAGVGDGGGLERVVIAQKPGECVARSDDDVGDGDGGGDGDVDVGA